MTNTPPDAPSPGAPTTTPSLYDRSAPFFESVRRWGLTRSDDRWLGGVCGGVARRLGLDPLLVRGLTIVLVIVTGPGAVLYGLAWLFLPQGDGRIHAQQVLRGDVTAGFVGGALVLLAGFGDADRPGPAMNGGMVVGVLVVLAVWWLVTRGSGCGPQGPSGVHGHGGDDATAAGTTAPTSSMPSSAPSTIQDSWTAPPAAPFAEDGPGATTTAGTASGVTLSPAAPDRAAPLHAVTLATLGAAVIAVGVVALWDATGAGMPGRPVVLALAGALGVVALGVVVAGLLGHRAGGLAPVGVLLAIALVGASVVPTWAASVEAAGTVEQTPTTVERAEEGYGLGVGQLTVDLTDAALLPDAPGTAGGRPLEVPAQVGVGALVLRVPRTATVLVKAQVGLGTMPRSDTSGESGGPAQERTLRYGDGTADIVVDANVGVGRIDVERVSS